MTDEKQQAALRIHSTCVAQDCQRNADFMSRSCRVHEALDLCRLMTGEDLAAFRWLLQGVVPLTDEERTTRRQESQLRLLASEAKGLARSRLMCADLDIDEDRITAAITVAEVQALVDHEKYHAKNQATT